MAQPYIGEIRLFAGSFAPAGWAFCNGQLMPISENDAMFTLIGTTYGGDGQETFALPNLQSRVPVHQGQGPGISQNYVLAEMFGAESVTLTTQQMPIHNHSLLATTSVATSDAPLGNVLAVGSKRIYTSTVPNQLLDVTALVPAGGSQPHPNTMPHLTISFIISLYGIFPQQT